MDGSALGEAREGWVVGEVGGDFESGHESDDGIGAVGVGCHEHDGVVGVVVVQPFFGYRVGGDFVSARCVESVVGVSFVSDGAVFKVPGWVAGAEASVDEEVFVFAVSDVVGVEDGDEVGFSGCVAPPACAEARLVRSAGLAIGFVFMDEHCAAQAHEGVTPVGQYQSGEAAQQGCGGIGSAVDVQLAAWV